MLSNTLIEQILVEKAQFENEMSGRETFKHSRWQSQVEGLFIDQLEKLSRQEAEGLITYEQIGQYVVSFFSTMIDDEAFSL